VNGASKYQFCYRISDDSPTSWWYYDNITTTSYTVNNSPDYFVTGVEYTCWVIAVNACGDGIKSAEVTFAPAGVTTITSVSVSPSSVSVAKGGTQSFSATVSGTGSPVQTVKWSVSGNNSSSTTITSAGLLTVASNETAISLTVKATSIVEPSKSGTALVTMPTYRLTVNSGSGSANYAPGTVVPIAANIPPIGQLFDKWTVDVYGIANINTASTTFLMGTSAATITATYKPVANGNKTVEQSDVNIYSVRASLIAKSDIAIKSVEIYNLLGYAVRHVQVNHNEARIDNLPKGVLIVAITLQGGKIEIRKVFIY
jgi:hypothetical protein